MRNSPCLDAMPAAADIEQFRLFPFTLATTELAMLNTSTSVSGCIEMEAHGSGVATLFPCPARVDVLCRRLRCPDCQSTPACRSCTDFQCSAKDGTCPKATDCEVLLPDECATFVDHCKNTCGGEKAGICDCGASGRFVSCQTSDCPSPVLFATCSSECPQGIQECNCLTNRVLCQPKNETLTAASTATFPPADATSTEETSAAIAAGAGAVAFILLVVIGVAAVCVCRKRKSAAVVARASQPSEMRSANEYQAVRVNHPSVAYDVGQVTQTAVEQQLRRRERWRAAVCRSFDSGSRFWTSHARDCRPRNRSRNELWTSVTRGSFDWIEDVAQL
jgi:hypothetical protein